MFRGCFQGIRNLYTPMDDKLFKKQSTFTFNIHRLIEQAYKLGFQLSIGEAYRTPELQNSLSIQEIRLAPDRAHMKRLAVDFVIIKDNFMLFQDPFQYKHDSEICKSLIDYWLSLNTMNEWGGNFKEELFEPRHFEMKDL